MFPILNLSGNAFERGYAYGVQARVQILGSVRTYASLFARCGISWIEAQQRAGEFCDAVSGIGGVIEELEGIAAGSGFKLNEILALNCRTEILPPTLLPDTNELIIAALRKNEAQGLFELSECTSFAVAGSRCADGATRVAQNWDWVGLQRNNIVVLRVMREPQLPNFLTLTEAGMLAKIGINANGLAIGLNILRATNDRQRVGIPVHVFQRLALDLDSVTDVVALAKTLRFSASSNAIVGDAQQTIASIEYGPNGVEVISADQGVVVHTNHFCAASLAAFQAPLSDSPTSDARFERANQHVTGWPDRITTRNITTLLRDECSSPNANPMGAICRAPDAQLPAYAQVESLCGVVMNCATREMLVAPGLPSRLEFRSIALYDPGS